MSFSIKHLLIVVLYAGVGLAAFVNSNSPVSVSAVRLLAFATLIIVAYGIWTSIGEERAFRIGFTIWGGLYFLFNVAMRTMHVDVDFGLSDMIMYYLMRLIAPERYYAIPHDWELVSKPLVSLLCGLIGGSVTVYFYRKRQRMQETKA